MPFLLVAGCGDLSRSDDPAFNFETTFGHKPGSGITGLLGEGYGFRNSGHVYLRFQCTQADFVALLGTSFAATTQTDFAERSASGSTIGPVPTWWKPLPGATEFWRSDTFHPTFSRGGALAAFDAATSTAYVYWDGLG